MGVFLDVESSDKVYFIVHPDPKDYNRKLQGSLGITVVVCSHAKSQRANYRA
jgi:hypothetical protein